MDSIRSRTYSVELKIKQDKNHHIGQNYLVSNRHRCCKWQALLEYFDTALSSPSVSLHNFERLSAIDREVHRLLFHFSDLTFIEFLLSKLELSF